MIKKYLPLVSVAVLIPHKVFACSGTTMARLLHADFDDNTTVLLVVIVLSLLAAYGVIKIGRSIFKGNNPSVLRKILFASLLMFLLATSWLIYVSIAQETFCLNSGSPIVPLKLN